jgi:photosystem II stability/assembly factor-like uncharacterized protein
MADDLEAYPEQFSHGRGERATRLRRGGGPGTHKSRANWYRAREAWPFREIAGETLANERSRIESETDVAALAVTWDFAGPSNIGGRMTAVLVHPTDADRIVAGAAGGGIWRSTDAGRNWQSLWHKQPTLNIGALAMDPNDPDTIYCGTGEANLSADSHPGVGVFVTRDGGDNWGELSASAVAGLPNRIGSIAVDPFDSNHIRLGGVSHSFTDVQEGMYVSRDGGGSWSRENGITGGRYRCHQVLFDPVNQGTVYATLSANGFLSGVWRSNDGGTIWTHLLTDLPHPTSIQRGAIALAPSDPQRLYLQLADGNGAVLGVYRSDNGGGQWQQISGNHFRSERQMNYNNTIAVHPTDPDHVLCGGVDIHRSLNGGQSWRRVTDWAADRGTPQYAHADQHALVLPTARPGRVYAGNDGGVDLSEDGGGTWTNRSDDLAVTMYYDLEVAQSDSDMYGGGCQDNGTNVTTSGSSDDHRMIAGGDGGWITIDPTDPLHLYASSQRMRILRHRSSDAWADVSPLSRNSAERRRMWMVFIAMDPNDPRRVFTGTFRVWRTLNDGDDWDAVSGNLDGSDVTAIEIARADSNRVYVGTENGGIFRSDDGGDTWTGDVSGPLLPGNTVTRLKSDPRDADVVYATMANVGQSHVFRSSDGGVSWQDVDGGRLPNVPHHGIAISTARPDQVFVANDVGVFASLDSGGSWSDITANLPNVMVIDLVYHAGDNHLFAATYGRSIWRLDLAGL